jgi:hypothetical protein
VTGLSEGSKKPSISGGPVEALEKVKNRKHPANGQGDGKFKGVEPLKVYKTSGAAK